MSESEPAAQLGADQSFSDTKVMRSRHVLGSSGPEHTADVMKTPDSGIEHHLHHLLFRDTGVKM